MPKSNDIVIFCDDSRFKEFLAPYVEACSQERGLRFVRESRRDGETVERYLRDAGALWFDGFDDALVQISARGYTDGATVICGIRGSECLDADVDRCRWEFFDYLVLSNPISRDVLLHRFDRIESFSRLRDLPPALPIPEVDVSDKKRTYNLAHVGAISAERNAALLLQCLASLVATDRRWKLYVIGSFASVSLQLYFEHLIGKLKLADNIEFNSPETDLGQWYADKSYFLSPFTCSGWELEVYRAMSYGLKPLVHDYFGAARMFGEEHLFAAPAELGALVRDANWQPEEYRNFVIENRDLKVHRAAFAGLLTERDGLSESPKVSVLVPTYNRARLLERLLTKLNEQTYTNREIVVVDDCSTDDTSEVVERLKQKRADIVYFRNEVNQGNAATMALAAEKATGDYVLSCSDDDLLSDDAIKLFVEYAQRKDAELVYADLAVLDIDGKQQGVWEYRNYYSNAVLLHDLILNGGNLIPEVFFVKRELYRSVYTETYARRFLNTYYLPHLRRLRMLHLPRALYGYTVHHGSTFSSAAGLHDRCKSTQNFVNAAMFMYSPLAVFSADPNLSATEQIARAYYTLASILIGHGKHYVSGEIYTGANFRQSDHLYRVYFHNAFHWLCLARAYGLQDGAFRPLLETIISTADPREFDPVSHARMPAVYKRLPWFANKPFNNLSQFVALDLVTIGAPPWLSSTEYSLFREGKAQLSVCNHLCVNMEQFEAAMSSNPITVINVFDIQALEAVVGYLIEMQLFSTYLFNFTDVEIPALEVLRNIFNVASQGCSDFDQYLSLVTKLTTTDHYAYTSLQTVS